MNRDKKATISVQGTEVILLSHRKEDYISLTDMAKYKDSMEPSLVISHWMSTRYTIEFMGIWEQINNPDFKPTEFGRFRMEAGSNGFIMTPKRWMENTAGIGVFSKSGRYGGGTVSSISKRESKIGGVWRSQSVPTAEPIFKNVYRRSAEPKSTIYDDNNGLLKREITLFQILTKVIPVSIS